MKIVFKRFSLLLIALLTLFPFQGKCAWDKIRHYSIGNGLSNNRITALMQDKQGFIWIGTSDGLNCYDSRNFKVYRHNLKDSATVSHNHITCITQSQNGTIWIGTANGVCYLSANETSFKRLEICKDSANQDSKNFIFAIDEDLDGNIWFTSYGEGIYKYSPKNGKMDCYKSFTREDNTINTNCSFSRITINENNEIYVGTLDYGVLKYSPEMDKFTIIRRWTDTHCPTYIYAMTHDYRGDVWIGDHNIYHFNPNDTIKCNMYKYDSEQSFGRITYCIKELTANQFVIGSNKGLTIINTANDTEINLKQDKTAASSISENTISSLLVDRDGNIWAGTRNNGLNYIYSKDEWITTHPITPQSEEDTKVNCFTEDNSGNIYIGTQDNDIFKFSVQSNKFQQFKPKGEPLPLLVNALQVYDNSLWIGAYSNGLIRMNSDGSSKRYNKHHDRANMSTIYSLYQDSHNRLWAGSHTGLFLYDNANDEFNIAIELGYEADVNQIIEDSKNTLWLATKQQGLISYDTRSKELIKHSLCDTLPLTINALTILNEKIYVGTAGYGLYIYDLKKNHFYKYPSPLFETHTTIEDIGTLYNDIWAVTNRGIIKINPNTENVHCYNHDQELIDCALNSMLISKSGEIYVGSNKGFNIYHPQKAPQKHINSSIVFNNIKLDEDVVKINNNCEKQHDNQYTCNIKVPYTYKQVHIDFIQPDYSAQSQIALRYKLNNFDKNWNYSNSNQGGATYTNLTKGTYTFEVQSRNNNGEWGEDSALIKLIVLPPWWASHWMIAIYITLLITTIIAAYSYLLHRANAINKQKIQDIVNENEKRLSESKIKFFTHLTHEIRTPVNLILTPLEQIIGLEKAVPAEIKEDLNIAYKNGERLLTLINQILDFNKIEQNGSINPTTFNLTEMVENMTLRFKPTIKQKGINLVTDFPEQKININTDIEALTKILSNLMTNALKFTKDLIKITISQTDTHNIIISVYDNGIGIKKDEIDRVFDTFYQGEASDNLPLRGFGIGLSLVNILVKRLNGTINVDSIQGKYTNFTIELPANIPLDKTVESTSEQDSTLQKRIINPINIGTNESNNQGTMLIVEDNSDMMHYLVKTFNKTFTTITAFNGAEALEKINENKIDIIISDVMMPIMNGIELCNKLKGNINTSHIPIILLTAKVDNNSKIEGLENGADVYIEKPVSFNYLYAQVMSLVENRNKLRELFSQKPFTAISSVTENKTEKKWLESVTEYIQQNISNTELSVDDIANNANMSRTLLYSKLKTITGMTPNELIRLIRLRKAAELISAGEYKINEICYMVGYNNPSYFAKCFQNQFGVLPKEYIGKPNSEQIK